MIQDVWSLIGVFAGASTTHLFIYSQLFPPGSPRQASSPTLKLVLTLISALIDFQGTAPAGLSKLAELQAALPGRRGRPKPGGRGWMDGCAVWMNEPPSDLLSARTASSGRTGVNSTSRPHTQAGKEREYSQSSPTNNGQQMLERHHKDMISI